LFFGFLLTIGDESHSSSCILSACVVQIILQMISVIFTNVKILCTQLPSQVYNYSTEVKISQVSTHAFKDFFKKTNVFQFCDVAKLVIVHN
jgi:hypothetical protein